jgi:hypothetical protein
VGASDYGSEDGAWLGNNSILSRDRGKMSALLDAMAYAASCMLAAQLASVRRPSLKGTGDLSKAART